MRARSGQGLPERRPPRQDLRSSGPPSTHAAHGSLWVERSQSSISSHPRALGRRPPSPAPGRCPAHLSHPQACPYPNIHSSDPREILTYEIFFSLKFLAEEPLGGSVVECLPLAQVMISGSWDCALHQASCSVWLPASPFPSLAAPPLGLCSLSLIDK